MQRPMYITKPNKVLRVANFLKVVAPKKKAIAIEKPIEMTRGKLLISLIKKKNRKSFRLAMEFTTILCRQIQLKKLRCFRNRKNHNNKS